MSQAQLEKKVEEYLRNVQALEDNWQKPITAEQLQAEMDRMARDTKQPGVLRELFDALGNNPFLIAECLARPVLSERLITTFAQEQSKGHLALSEVGANSQTRKVVLANTTYALPTISDATTGCTPDTWTDTNTNAPSGRIDHTAVWTGSEMIVWGGQNENEGLLDTGGRYNPSTDSWTATTTNNAPTARGSHTAVWTGSEMIAWGGVGSGAVYLNTGGRYNPSTDSWTAASTTNAPSARFSHTAVWTGNGNEMIVWGGSGTSGSSNTGGRYDPSTDSWTATSTTNAPEPRYGHTAIWTGTEMVAWGGADTGPLNTGGRYCAQSGATTPTPTPTATASPTATATSTPTATPTPTPTPTPCTGRCTPTPRPRPTPAPRP